MSNPLLRWNRLPVAQAANEILPCCGSHAWARAMTERRPIAGKLALFTAADEIWRSLSRTDWLEAFRSHPRIGESGEGRPKRSAEWSGHEQSGVASADTASKQALAAANREYEERFGHIFIVCATGKTTAEIMGILRRRLQNDPETEWREAAEQQRQITHRRLKRWLAE